MVESVSPEARRTEVLQPLSHFLLAASSLHLSVSSSIKLNLDNTNSPLAHLEELMRK